MEENMDTEENESEGEEKGEESESEGIEESEYEEDEEGEEETTNEEGGSEPRKEQAGNSEETKVVSEEHTEIVGSGDERDQEEVEQPEDVEQPEEREEHDILELEDEDTDDERASRRGARMSRRMEEILAAKRYRGEVKDTSEGEEEIPLIRRPRNARVAVDEEASTEEAEGEVPIHTEAGDETEAEDKAEAGERARADRKRKGKMISHPKQKKTRTAARHVVIQEPIQVPHKPADEETERDGEAKREAEDVSGRRKENISSYYERVFVKVDRQLLERMGKFRDPKQQAECKKRVSGRKKVKSGKRVCIFPPYRT